MLTRKVALGVAAVVAAGVIGTAGVAAATAPATPAPAPTASEQAPGDRAGDKAGEARRHALRARGMHGEWVVKGRDGAPVTLASVRGTVTAVGAASVTVRAEDGYTATYTVNAGTRVRGADIDAISDVAVGARAVVVGVKDGGTLTARRVLVRK